MQSFFWASFWLIPFLFRWNGIPKAMGCKEKERIEERQGPKQRKLNELLYAEIVKSGTYRLATGQYSSLRGDHAQI